MKPLACFSLILIIAFFFLPIPISSRPISHHNSSHGQQHKAAATSATSTTASSAKPKSYWPEKKATTATTTGRKGVDTVELAGSRLPDCSHACGSCSPCRLVMISFLCASLQEAETCPMAYRCMCNNKSYPVP